MGKLLIQNLLQKTNCFYRCLEIFWLQTISNTHGGLLCIKLKAQALWLSRLRMYWKMMHNWWYGMQVRSQVIPSNTRFPFANYQQYTRGIAVHQTQSTGTVALEVKNVLEDFAQQEVWLVGQILDHSFKNGVPLCKLLAIHTGLLYIKRKLLRLGLSRLRMYWKICPTGQVRSQIIA